MEVQDFVKVDFKNKQIKIIVNRKNNNDKKIYFLRKLQGANDFLELIHNSGHAIFHVKNFACGNKYVTMIS